MERKIIATLLIIIFIFSFSACRPLQQSADNPVTQSGDQGESAGQDTTPQPGSEDHLKSIIEDKAMEVLTAIKNYDMEKLSDHIHPDKGVRFSPYAYVDTDKDLVFTAEEVKNLTDDSKIYVWGHYDGSGDPIELSFRNYYSMFIYDADFINAEQVSYNKILGQGNTINNSFEVYKDSMIVEYYFSGIDPKYEGMDWRSLRLVFEKKDASWYIVGIIHDQWTI